MLDGELGILNVGHGHAKLSFDPANPEEREAAARTVRDMLSRGYLIAVEVERDGKKVLERVTDFREDTYEYVVEEAPESGSKRRVGRSPGRRVAAAGTRGVAVARSAGG